MRRCKLQKAQFKSFLFYEMKHFGPMVVALRAHKGYNPFPTPPPQALWGTYKSPQTGEVIFKGGL